MDTSKNVKNDIQVLRNNDDPAIDSIQSSFDALSGKMREHLPKVINQLKASTPQGGEADRGRDVFHQSLLDQQMVDADSDQLALLESEVNQILTTMKEVNALFEKTMQELQSQRHLIISVDKMTSKAAEDMSMGTLELEKAGDHQKKSRKCLCWIFLIILVIVVCVVIFVAVLLSKKKKSSEDGGDTPASPAVAPPTPAPSADPTPVPPTPVPQTPDVPEASTK
ncbi:hypothetical protein TRFO_18451 [Tritrichomonas foetus]|uniref:t-SNARE coiled-coil homology domain-containing protein n=1 Tax=Tritrichomonas foetus TaxID=1144522 RepID=A0A1J4KKQ0_9EUKA|nr:hypothetical protein TRFO_18451 [Tritrichomonas foetus]|eukprot:OHT11881.1 hypothetical protein TRFO_18451 [Tritrichomonas foetus]